MVEVSTRLGREMKEPTSLLLPEATPPIRVMTLPLPLSYQMIHTQENQYYDDVNIVVRTAIRTQYGVSHGVIHLIPMKKEAEELLVGIVHKPVVKHLTIRI